MSNLCEYQRQNYILIVVQVILLDCFWLSAWLGSWRNNPFLLGWTRSVTNMMNRSRRLPVAYIFAELDGCGRETDMGRGAVEPSNAYLIKAPLLSRNSLCFSR